MSPSLPSHAAARCLALTLVHGAFFPYVSPVSFAGGPLSPEVITTSQPLMWVSHQLCGPQNSDLRL